MSFLSRMLGELVDHLREIDSSASMVRGYMDRLKPLLDGVPVEAERVHGAL